MLDEKIRPGIEHLRSTFKSLASLWIFLQSRSEMLGCMRSQLTENIASFPVFLSSLNTHVAVV